MSCNVFLKNLLAEKGPLYIHQQIQNGDESIINWVIKNAENAISEANEQEFRIFYEIWQGHISYWIECRLTEWEWLLNQNNQSIEDKKEQFVQEVFLKLIRKSYNPQGFGLQAFKRLKGFLFITVRNVIIDVIRSLLPTPGRIEKAMIECYKESYSKELLDLINIFNDENRYKSILKRRTVRRLGIINRLRNCKDYYKIMKLTLEGLSPKNIASVLNEDKTPDMVRKLKNPHAILEIWLNLCNVVSFEGKFSDLKEAILGYIVEAVPLIK